MSAHRVVKRSWLSATIVAAWESGRGSGIALPAILEEICPHLAGMTHREIGAADLKPMTVSHLLNGAKAPSLAALAALAKASGGR